MFRDSWELFVFPSNFPSSLCLKVVGVQVALKNLLSLVL